MCLKNPPDRRPKALGAVDHRADLSERSPRCKNAVNARSFSVPNKPQHHLFALNRDAQGNEVVLKALAVQDQAHEVIPLQGALAELLSLRALARMKRRETVEGESPKASGTASAHPS